MRTIRPFPSSPVVAVLVILTTFFHQCCHGCFNQVESLELPKVWLQATGVQAFLQYEAGAKDAEVLRVIPRGRDTSGQKTLKCIKLHSPNETLVEFQQQNGISSKDVSSSFQCLRFELLTKGVIRLSRTKLRSSMKEVNCDSDPFIPDSSILMDSSTNPYQKSSLHGSYQAQLYNLQDSNQNAMLCAAKIHFNCNSKNILVTFGSLCKPPVHKYYSNKVRYHSLTSLSHIAEWLVEDNDKNFKIMVLRSNTDKGSSLNVWCLHYRMINGSSENFQIYISFDGRCSSKNPFNKNNKDVFSKDTMFGHLASFVSNRDPRCSDKFYSRQCQNRNVDCLETNSCPHVCGRCYTIPKPDKCQFMSGTLGNWKVVGSTNSFSMELNKDGLETSSQGKFSCRYSDEKKLFFTNPVVQYDWKNSYCMPIYACMQLFNIAPGVSTFYLRQTIPADNIFREGEPDSCENTNELFKEHPVSDGEMITLMNVAKLKQMPCEFGYNMQFPTTRGSCLFNVEDCVGKSCMALNVSYDNSTCHENPPFLPVAEIHQCYAIFKFQDHIRGLLTYSDELEKYACWIYSATRLFVVEPQLCNSEAAERVFADKYADEKYDPIKAFTIPVNYGTSSKESNSPRLYLNFLNIVFSILFIRKPVF